MFNIKKIAINAFEANKAYDATNNNGSGEEEEDGMLFEAAAEDVEHERHVFAKDDDSIKQYDTEE